MSVEEVKFNEKVVAIILRKEMDLEGVNFFTNHENAFQLGFLSHKKGRRIKPHIHKPVEIKKIGPTQEVLHLQEGKMKVTFCDRYGNKFDTKVINEGDTILLISEGHAIDIIEDSKIIEIKQGPYINVEEDKEFLEVKE